jgi:branched-chain amino acid transport system substrate-binding protein
MVVGVVVCAATVGTACSSSGKGGSANGGSSASPTTAADTSAVLGPPKAASGEPIKIGYIGAGKADAIDNSDEFVMAKATAQYINGYLGGLAGRPVELITCEDHVTPAGATDCANQLIADHVGAVLASQPSNPAPILTVAKAAKTSFMPWIGADPAVLIGAGAYDITNPLATIAGPIRVAKQTGAKKVAIVSVDVPAAKQLPTFAKPLYEQAGLELTTTFVPLGTPDVTPQIQSAISDGADEFSITGDISLCTNTLKALKTLGFTGKVVSNQNCLLAPSASSIGGFDGLMFSNVYSIDPNDPDMKLATAIAAKYAPDITVSGANTGNVLGGFSNVIGFARAMTALTPANATPTGIEAAIKAMAPQQMPLMEGQTFQCNGKASSLLTSVCSNGASLATLDAKGAVTKNENFDTSPYVTTK